jgi:hypothetical protein
MFLSVPVAQVVFTVDRRVLLPLQQPNVLPVFIVSQERRRPLVALASLEGMPARVQRVTTAHQELCLPFPAL